MLNRFLIKILVLCLLVFGYCTVAYADPDLTARAVILIDMKNKQVLLVKNADAKMYPASTTKIMTAMLAIKNGNLDVPVTVSHAACLVEGSNIGLREGEKMPLRDLIYALLLPSANDAALAVAEHIGGSVEDFVAMMNDEAQRLGATGTHFANPHGLPDANHYTTRPGPGAHSHVGNHRPHV